MACTLDGLECRIKYTGTAGRPNQWIVTANRFVLPVDTPVPVPSPAYDILVLMVACDEEMSKLFRATCIYPPPTVPIPL